METNTRKHFGYILAGVFAFILLLVQYSRSKEINENKRLKSNIEAINDTVRYQKNKIGTITASKRAIEVTAKELKKQVFVKDEKIAKLTKDFKNLKSVTKTVQEVEIKEVPIVFKDTVPCNFERTNEVREQWYKMDVFTNQRGVTIKDLKIPNEQYTIIGDAKGGLFKPLTLETQVTNTNPNITTTNIQTQVLWIEQPFYNKGWFRVAEMVGAFTLGAFITK